MAIDVYLQIDGIRGESVSWSISQPKSATSSTGGGHTAERAELSDISFHKACDMASPILAQTCATGKTIPKAKFEFWRAYGQGERIKYCVIDFANVLISHVAPSVGAGSIMSENIALKFSKMKWRYCQQKVTGGAGGNTAGGWDLATNRIAS
jgi:type VI secretion system secreted protein Hcp